MKILIPLIFLLYPLFNFGQDSIVVFDRPGIADSPYLVQKNTWQVESGLAYMKKTGIQSSLLPNVMLRKYLFQKTELRLTCNYEPQMFSIIKKDFDNNFDNLALGFKHKLFNEKNWIPEASLILNTFCPFQKFEYFQIPSLYYVELNFQFHNNINEYMGINYNAGSMFGNSFKQNTLSYALCLNLNPHHRFSFFLEAFGYKSLKEKIIDWGYDAGIMFYPNKFAQIDFSIVDNVFNKTHYASLLIGYSYAISKN